MKLIAPTALVRLDEPILERIRRGEELPRVVVSAVVSIAAFAGAYGVAFGVWRAPEQAAYSAIKLPLLFLSVALGTVALGAMLAMLLRSRLTLGQTAVCMLVSLAVTAIVLGSLAPIGVAIDLAVPQPAAIGSDARTLAASSSVGHALLLLHTAAIAGAGTAGVVRLRTLLARLGLSEHVARRVLVSWIAAQFAVGSQLCWLLRPFFGEPRVAPTFFAAGVLEGSFFRAVGVLLRSTFGACAPFVLAIAAIGVVALLSRALRVDRELVAVEVGASGIAVGTAKRFVPWSALARVRRERGVVAIDLVADESLGHETLWVAGAGDDGAQLARALEEGRLRVASGPFRTRPH